MTKTLSQELREVDPQDVSAVIQALGAGADEIERLRAALELIAPRQTAEGVIARNALAGAAHEPRAGQVPDLSQFCKYGLYPWYPTCAAEKSGEAPYFPPGARRLTLEEMKERYGEDIAPSGLLMPDGSVRPVPGYLNKHQSLWTDAEKKKHAAFQEECLQMQRAAERT